MEISRWCQPTGLEWKTRQAPAGRWNGIARFPPPLPGLVGLVCGKPVVGTTG